MEIRFDRVSYKKLNNVNFTIPSGKITGITGNTKDTILQLIYTSLVTKGTIYYDDKKRVDYDNLSFCKDIVMVEDQFDNMFHIDSVYEYFVSYLNYYHIVVSNVEEKIRGAFKIVGLDDKIMTYTFNMLASSELKLVQLALSFLSNPKVILLDEPFIDLDEKNEKKVYRILEKLKDKYHKTIVIFSKDSNVLYQYTSYLIVMSSTGVLVNGDCEDIYFNNPVLEEHDIDIPEVVRFIKLVEEKKHVKLDHRKDVRDVIKDIYRSVAYL